MELSIIICAYNPQPRALLRLLDALLSFDQLSHQHEVSIKGNNSTVRFKQRKAYADLFELVFENKMTNA